jgi:tetratricopeptide (TPR) repeat protein
VALPVLAALADKSLLQAQDSGRFGLHPLIRQCALARAGVPDIVRQRHAEHVARWLERLGESAGSTRWRDIERSMVHLRSAWAWALAQRQGELVSRSARALMLYFEGQGLWAEGMILLAGGVDAFGAFEACARDGDLAGAAALCHCLRALATLQYRAGELEGAESSARRGLRLAQRLRDGRAVKANLNTLGLSLWLRGRFREAQPCFAQALRRAERDNDTPGAAVFIGNLAMVETALGNYAQAVALYERSLAGDRSLRTPASLANTLNNAANAARALDAREHAHARLAEALALCERHQLRSVRPFVLVNLACWISRTGRPRRHDAGSSRRRTRRSHMAARSSRSSARCGRRCSKAGAARSRPPQRSCVPRWRTCMNCARRRSSCAGWPCLRAGRPNAVRSTTPAARCGSPTRGRG